jgi:hypothetical protein
MSYRRHKPLAAAEIERIYDFRAEDHSTEAARPSREIPREEASEVQRSGLEALFFRLVVVMLALLVPALVMANVYLVMVLVGWR